MATAIDKRVTRIVICACIFSLFFPLCVDAYVGFQQWRHIHSSEYAIEGFKVVNLEFKAESAWIIYKSTDNPRLFKMRSCYYDELPFGNLVRADTDSSATNNKDAFIDNTLPNNNYGSYPLVICSRSGYPPHCITDYSFTEWTMPSNSGTITSVVLEIYISNPQVDGTWGNFLIHYVSDSWAENTITWNNAPTTYGLIHSEASTNLPDESGWHEWELEDDSFITGDGLVSDFGISWGDTFTVRFAIAYIPDGNGTISHSYYARTYETTSLRPVLVITYTA